jgi:hypothetical protein
MATTESLARLGRAPVVCLLKARSFMQRPVEEYVKQSDTLAQNMVNTVVFPDI